MDYARELPSGKVIAANDASPNRLYVCPRPGCGGRVYRPHVVVQRPHFRHAPGEGTPECDAYFPDIGAGGESDVRSIAAVEDDPAELGLLLTQVDGRWGLGLRLPEIPSQELGVTSLGELRSAFINVYPGLDRQFRVSALDLRPGVGAARVDVVPSLQVIRTQPDGSWPASINKERWFLESRGLVAEGTVFRLRLGEWVRLRAGSGVHQGESLLVIADTRCAPPRSIASEIHARIHGRGAAWSVWEVQLPGEPTVSASTWLTRLGHEVIPYPWSMALATPPQGYGQCGEPIFWVGDSPVLVLNAPRPTSTTTVTFDSGTNSYSAEVRATSGRFAQVSVSVPDARSARMAVAGERNASLDLEFQEQVSLASLGEMLLQTARIRIQIGQQLFAAWLTSTHFVHVDSREQPEVFVDLGDESARARVTVWERGKQRPRLGIDSRGVARAIEEALVNADRIEVDAGNLGQVVLIPIRGKVCVTDEARSSDRLAWRDRLIDICTRRASHFKPSLSQQPRDAKSFAVRRLTQASLVRSRLSLQRRIKQKGSNL